MRWLEGRSAVVTGAAGGIGAPVARMLREAGARVVGIDRVDCPACDATALCDLSNEAALRKAAGLLATDPPDILVNIAGVMCFGLLETQPIERVELCYRVNLIVPAVLARAVAGPMRERGSGQIVNIGSVLGAIPYPWFAVYSSSKAGLAGFSQALGRELEGSGVTVTHVSPRAVRTAFNHGGVDRFLEVVRMKADDPEVVAARIVGAIRQRRARVNIGVAEKLYAALNALAPALIDSGLKPQIARARAQQL